MQQQLQVEKAKQREQAADQVVVRASELDELADLFIDCIHTARKSLRQTLVKLRLSDG